MKPEPIPIVQKPKKTISKESEGLGNNMNIQLLREAFETAHKNKGTITQANYNKYTALHELWKDAKKPKEKTRLRQDIRDLYDKLLKSKM